jgi:hypothetical protein
MGSDGKQARNFMQENKGVDLLNKQSKYANDPRLQAALQGYSSGKMSLQDALKSVTSNNSGRKSEIQQQLAQLETQRMKKRSTVGDHALGAGIGGAVAGPMGAAIGGIFGGGDDMVEDEGVRNQMKALSDEMTKLQDDEDMNRFLQHQIYTDPTTGTLAATDQVKSNDLFKNVFGDGGLNDRLNAEEQDLAKRGWGLQMEDHEAYGQASGDIARMFGAEEQGLAQALADRGLASAPSGAAGVGFSGLMGNKSERLAAKQHQIADSRMKMNLDRLSNTRNFMMEGNKLAQAAVGDQFSRNRHGVNDYQNTLKDSAHAAQMLQGQENVGFEQVEATRGPTLGEVAMGTLGTAASAGLGAATGGAGTSLGAGLGMKLGGVNPYLTKDKG